MVVKNNSEGCLRKGTSQFALLMTHSADQIFFWDLRVCVAERRMSVAVHSVACLCGCELAVISVCFRTQKKAFQSTRVCDYRMEGSSACECRWGGLSVRVCECVRSECVAVQPVCDGAGRVLQNRAGSCSVCTAGSAWPTRQERLPVCAPPRARPPRPPPRPSAAQMAKPTPPSASCAATPATHSWRSG